MKAMTLKTIAAALVLGLGTAAGSAGAAVLTFDGLAEFVVYGNSGALPANMSYDGKNLTYQESGFLLTLNAPESAAGDAHIGDGTFEPQTYNWHDGMENGSGTYATLTRVGGGMFNLLGFDYYTDWSALSANGNQVGVLEGAGTWNTALNGISELRLGSGAFNQLDNVAVENADGSVPLPGSLPLMLGGLGACAVVRRRRQ
ncbi:VPLPA-CTERM sorting domain-containing protein [Duganella sp. FT92W]|uniref:VPLPA-CTERM sorting domain-containing protein n=1 Tax=Pseudoduganella rivuli TaxID=2666085 RepID=A0A7X2IQK9_9BURK|nr:VPLPA-CTERM sorting domain-containing protein [Pseudoduganella rivuli]MRV73748.1 VPLPA-CTERM sorting domain-containing protein [Pseudoduganella rivuli]